MLVNQDALIQENNSVATVWLLSTIGSRSSARRISRREIQGVSIPETCSVIKETPEGTSLSLRVSSSLLYGVSVVYRQKTDFLTSDAQMVRTRLQRDLVTTKGSTKLLVAPPILQVPSLNTLPPLATAHAQEKGQVLFHDDPLFRIADGLLPPLDGLDFLDPTTSTQQENDDRKQMIRAHDLANNTISHVMSHMTSSENDESLFSHGTHQQHDVLDSASEPQFMFDDDGMLLDLGGVETSATGPAIAGTDLINEEDELRMNDMDFDFDFQEDLDRVALEEEKRRRSSSVQAGEQALDEQAQYGEDVVPVTSPAAQSRPTKKRKTNWQVKVVFDDPVSVSTEKLRDCRDNYVTTMKSREKNLSKSKQTVTEILSEYDSLVPNFPFAQSGTHEPVIEERRGRSPTRPDDDEDFVSHLIRHRRSSSSIETARNASVNSRRNSRASISGIPLELNPGDVADESFNQGMDMDFDFGDYLGDGGADSATMIVDNSSSSSRKRSSVTSFQRFEPVHENAEMNYDMDYDGGEDLDRLQVEKEQTELRAKGTLTDQRSYDDTTSRFLEFIAYRFEEVQSTASGLTFVDLLGEEHFEDLAGDTKARSTVVSSFYSVLQLATHGKVQVIESTSTGKRWDLNGPGDFSVKLL